METTTIEVDLPTELLERVDDCFDHRGFDSREDFIVSAVRDAVNAEDPFPPEVREEINKAREEMEEGKGIPLKEMEERLELDTEED